MTTEPPAHARRWVPWTVIGAIAAVAVVAAIVLAPVLRPTTTAAAPSAEATGPAGEPAVEPATPTAPAAPDCTVTAADVNWHDTRDAPLPSPGRLQATPLEATTVLFPPESWAHLAIEPVDEMRSVILASARDDIRSSTQATVVDTVTREVLWSTAFRAHTWVVSSPALTGTDRIVFATDDGMLESFDISTGAPLVQRDFGEAYTIAAHGITGTTAEAWTAVTVPADAFLVSDRDAAHLVDATTLQTRWTVAGEDLGVGWSEGGVPFSRTTDVLFVGSHMVDAHTGAVLDRRIDGYPVHAAGAVLADRRPYEDDDGAFVVAGLDLTTGEGCWTRDVRDVAASGDQVWILTVDGGIEQVDPFTGETLETRSVAGAAGIELAGDTVVVLLAGEDPRYRLLLGDGTVLPVDAPGHPWAIGDGQLVMRDHDTARGVSVADGTALWTAQVDDSYSFGGGLFARLDTVETADGMSATVVLLH